MDILHSLSYVASVLPSPKETAGWWSRNAIGNTATCNIQGLVVYVGMLGSVLYDCMLSIYFVMVVVYSKREDFIQKKIEPFFHAISILAPVGAGIFLLVTNYFNDSGIICWISQFPSGCSVDDDIACTRGENATKYRWYFVGYPVILVVLIVLGCMVLLVWSVRKQSAKMKKYGANEFEAKVKRKKSMRQSTSGTNLHSKKAPRKSENETKQTCTQAVLYVMALFLTFVFAFTFQIVRTYFWLYLLEVTFIPLLGFFNFFIFIRPRVVMTMLSRPELSFFQAVYTAVTAKEVVSPAGRRGSMVMTMRRRRSCAQTLTGRRSSLMSSDAVLAAAAQIVQADEDERESEHGLEGIGQAGEDDCETEHGLKGMDINSPVASIIGIKEMLSENMSKSSEAQDIKDPSNTTDDVNETFNLTKDYTNML